MPSLNKKVDIKLYAEKITTYAVRFEAWYADELIGLVAAYFNDEKQASFITNVSTVPQYSGKGIASQLMKECISFANANRFNGITLRVAQHNSNAIALYSKFGFQQTGLEEGEVVMQKELAGE
ncbi:GNAT family N-acetyltransferase [Lacibacter sediminis]|uniref:GNAT family N-acetyltransferase n=1 Tax=Lacibacter sediminis TaxID=2760713 RepID=A0A7G5XHN1_9BACT|nr:GNAT family N-acetyltransferase [Lacibacter sediminis]QNA44984.1 GNAT family N-acetyltransferase [Lacibacter sediminis]